VPLLGIRPGLPADDLPGCAASLPAETTEAFDRTRLPHASGEGVAGFPIAEAAEVDSREHDLHVSLGGASADLAEHSFRGAAARGTADERDDAEGARETAAVLDLDEGANAVEAVVRLHADANYERGEYAVLVRSDLKGRGLGYLLMQMIIEYARAEGLATIEGQVLSENTAMLAMCKELGFEIASDPDDPDTCLVKLTLGH